MSESERTRTVVWQGWHLRMSRRWDAVKLEGDPQYSTHVNYSYSPPTLLSVAPRAFLLPGEPIMGPDQDLAPGASFESFRTFELLLDSDELLVCLVCRVEQELGY